MVFAQNLRQQIAKLNKKLNKLLDLQLLGVISIEEYAVKKQKVLNQKIEISKKPEGFERKSNRWLKLCRDFILTANQAQIAALQGNFSEKKDFFKRLVESAPFGTADFCRIQKPLEIG